MDPSDVKILVTLLTVAAILGMVVVWMIKKLKI